MAVRAHRKMEQPQYVGRESLAGLAEVERAHAAVHPRRETSLRRFSPRLRRSQTAIAVNKFERRQRPEDPLSTGSRCDRGGIWFLGASLATDGKTLCVDGGKETVAVDAVSGKRKYVASWPSHQASLSPDGKTCGAVWWVCGPPEAFPTRLAFWNFADGTRERHVNLPYSRTVRQPRFHPIPATSHARPGPTVAAFV